MIPRPMPAANAIGQRLHAGHDGGGQRREQHQRARWRRAGRDAGERRLEHEGEGGQAAGDHPHDGGEPPDRDAEQQGPVGVLGRGPHGDAGVGREQEPGQAGEDERHDQHDEDLVAEERLDAEVELEVERDR